MSIVRIAVSLLCCFPVCMSVEAQQSAAPAAQVQRDPQALAVLQKSLTAMGPAVPVDSTATGTVTLVEGSRTSSGTITILTRGTNQTLESLQLPDKTRIAIYSNGLATEGFSDNPVAVSMELSASSQGKNFPLPLLSAALNDPDFSLQYVAQETVNGSSVHHLRLFDTYSSNPSLQPLSDFTAKDLWVDATTGLPRKLAYQRRDGGGDAVPRITVEVCYSDWRNVNGVVYPYQIEKSWNGTPWTTIMIQSVTFQTGLTDANFPVTSQAAQAATTAAAEVRQ